MKKKTVFMATCLFTSAAAFAQTNNDSIRYDLTLSDVVVKLSLPKEKTITGGKSTRIVGTTLAKVGTAKQVIGHLSGVYLKKDGSIEVAGEGTPIYIYKRQATERPSRVGTPQVGRRAEDRGSHFARCEI